RALLRGVRLRRATLRPLLFVRIAHLLGPMPACQLVDPHIGTGLTQADRHGAADTRICPGDQSLLSDERSRDRCIRFYVGCGHLDLPQSWAKPTEIWGACNIVGSWPRGCKPAQT